MKSLTGLNSLVSLILLGLSYGFYLEIEGVKNITYILVWTFGVMFLIASIADYGHGKKREVLTTSQTMGLWIYKLCALCLALIVGYKGDYCTSAILLIEGILIKRPIS